MKLREGHTVTDGAKVDDATVTTADIMATNGIIHVIDFLITPPAKDIVDGGCGRQLHDARGRTDERRPCRHPQR
ncbi:MAG: fasciclin domain-containing protein [Polyangiaceae bacterium]